MGERRKIIWGGFRVSALFSVKSVVDGPTFEPRVQQMLRAIFYYHVCASKTFPISKLVRRSLREREFTDCCELLTSILSPYIPGYLDFNFCYH